MVRAVPTCRTPVSREASAPVTLMPLAVRAAAKLGLSTGICGAEASPECSPDRYSVLSKGRPRAVPTAMFEAISEVMAACEVQARFDPSAAGDCPAGMVTQRQGMT